MYLKYNEKGKKDFCIGETQDPLGRVLVLNNFIDKTDLKYALKLQKCFSNEFRWKLMGEILVDLDAITERQLDAALRIQAKNEEVAVATQNDLCTANSSQVKRILDIVASIILLCVTAPLFFLIILAIFIETQGPIFVSRNCLGLGNSCFKLLRFRITKNKNLSANMNDQNQGYTITDGNSNCFSVIGKLLDKTKLYELPLLINVLRGEMSIVGQCPHQFNEEQVDSMIKTTTRPGITGLWRINQSERSPNHKSLLELDRFYLKNWNYKLDIWILLKTVLKVFSTLSRKCFTDKSNLRIYPQKVVFLNMAVENISLGDLLMNLKSGVLHTLNIDHLVKLQYDPEFLEAYKAAEYKVCDSQVLVNISRFFGTPLKGRISGSDFLPNFYSYHSHNYNITIFLLGGLEKSAEKARDNINRKVGRNIVVEAHSPSFGFEKNYQECLNIVAKINACQATVLVIGVGAPKQEKWIYSYRSLLPSVKIFLAVGAAIDFEAGIQKRAPKWMSNLGFEWLHRLLCNPNRLWKRYLVDDVSCLGLIIRQKIGLY
jgi:N-acetylglucosaminyldiphosphoundecaprenol N-acetyl-beta-D-mannosaminyltransferase